MAAVEASHWWYVGTREICLALLMPHIGGGMPLRILDIGCGTGGNLAELARLGQARGIDLDPLVSITHGTEGWTVASATCSTSQHPQRRST